MFCSRKVICLFVLLYLPISTNNNLCASSLEDKLAMLGYSDEEIANVVSGKRCFKTMQLEHKMEMLGYDNTRAYPMKSVLYPELRAAPFDHQKLEEKAKSYFGIIADAAEKTGDKTLLF
jgi:hypothetical protein